MKRQLGFVATVLLLLLFAGYVWPTRYEHYKAGSVNIRVNRFNGATDKLTVAGWQASDPVRAYLAARANAQPSAKR